MQNTSCLNYDTDIEILSRDGSLPRSKAHSTSNPSLRAIARLLGRQAAMHVRKYRFEGLGRIHIILREARMNYDV